jgi:RNA polymerase sigma-70 factor (ECF subfamily)
VKTFPHVLLESLVNSGLVFKTALLELNDLYHGRLLAPDYEQTVERMFTDWFGNLYTYAFSILEDEATAEEVVQSVFCKIWERREQLQVHTSLRSYIYGSVYHECMDILRKKKNIQRHRVHVLRNGDRATDNAAGRVEMGELEQRLRQALDELPDQCRNIFNLSRFGELKYREIADLLGLSIKTVEAQMTKALKKLREKLVGYID